MTTQTARLSRELGLVGAIMMGLGSMIGTGVFCKCGTGGRRWRPFCDPGGDVVGVVVVEDIE